MLTIEIMYLFRLFLLTLLCYVYVKVYVIDVVHGFNFGIYLRHTGTHTVPTSIYI